MFVVQKEPSPLGKVACRRHDGRGVQAVRFRRNARKICTFHRTSPAPFGGTPFLWCDCHWQSFIQWAAPLSRGEGLRQHDKLKFEVLQTNKLPGGHRGEVIHISRHRLQSRKTASCRGWRAARFPPACLSASGSGRGRSPRSGNSRRKKNRNV